LARKGRDGDSVMGGMNGSPSFFKLSYILPALPTLLTFLSQNADKLLESLVAASNQPPGKWALE